LCWSRTCIVSIANIAGQLTSDRGFGLYWDGPIMILWTPSLGLLCIMPMDLNTKNMRNKSHFKSYVNVMYFTNID
jgi:hypothetical protein